VILLLTHFSFFSFSSVPNWRQKFKCTRTLNRYPLPALSKSFSFLPYNCFFFRIITAINGQPEPFCATQRSEPNPWHTGGGSDGGFCIIS
jgi:hypothetical protein